MHSRSLTTFEDCSTVTVKIDDLSFSQKLKMALTGMKICKPANDCTPEVPYNTFHITSGNDTLECWEIKKDSSKGTVLFFHGYNSSKSELVKHAEYIVTKGYSVILIDFYGSGGSSGSSTSIGYKEAQNIKDIYDYVISGGEQNVFIYSQSMGAAATLKAIKDYKIKPTAIMIESPFNTMYGAVEARFKLLHIPTFPMASFITFWGGMQRGYWAFGHNPIEYAKSVNCPTLLLHGMNDNRVSKEEIELISRNFPKPPTSVYFNNSEHCRFLVNDSIEWRKTIDEFLEKVN